MANKKKSESEELEVLPTTKEEKAKEFFDANENYPNEGIYVTSDLNIFHGNMKGENNCQNYCKTKTGVDYTFINK